MIGSNLTYLSYFCREVGLGQGLSLKVGLNEKMTSYLKFAYMVVSADDNVDESEARFMQQLFPTPLLQSLDLVDELGEFKEPAFTLAKTEALQVLPGALSIPDRVEILRTLQKAAWADGVLLPQETRVFRMARQLLEVPRDALD